MEKLYLLTNKIVINYFNNYLRFNISPTRMSAPKLIRGQSLHAKTTRICVVQNLPGPWDLLNRHKKSGEEIHEAAYGGVRHFGGTGSGHEDREEFSQVNHHRAEDNHAEVSPSDGAGVAVAVCHGIESAHPNTNGKHDPGEFGNSAANQE